MAAKKPLKFTALLRGLFLILSTAVYTFVLGGAACAVCFLDSYPRRLSVLQRLWVHLLLKTNRIRLQANGVEGLREPPYIFISNHASLLDIPAIIHSIPFPVRFVAKKSLTWFPFFGWALLRSGHILIERKNTKAAMQSLQERSSILRDGYSVVVFAEGTRTPDGEVKEFKRGGFRIALEKGIPIVPVSVSGTFQMLPRTGWCLWPGTIRIRFGKPIPTRGWPAGEIEKLMDEVRETIIRNLEPAGDPAAAT